MKNNITLDISQVKNSEQNDYPFVVVYNKQTYIGKVIVENPKPASVVTPGDEKQKKKEERSTT